MFVLKKTQLYLHTIYLNYKQNQNRRLATGNVQCVCSATYQIFFNIF